MAYQGKHSQSVGSEYLVHLDGTVDRYPRNALPEPLTRSFLGKLTADDDNDRWGIIPAVIL